ncbi:MAG: hypothetical protein GY854_09265, partial [Deltaproteobacteria bacterium]|nr:hypothetical protein [Deltaproteobacteria bacterium]
MKHSITLLLLFLSCIIAMHCNGNSVENHDDGGADAAADSNTDSDTGSDSGAGLTLEWALRIGGTESSRGNDLAVLKDGSVILTGSIRDTVRFGQDDNIIDLKSAGVEDVFVARYHSNGSLLWALNAGGIQWDEAESVDCYDDDSVAITGYFKETATFNGMDGDLSITSKRGWDAFTAKYDSEGTPLWAVSAGSELRVMGTGVVALPDGSSVATGIFDPPTTFGIGDNEVVLDSEDEDAIYLAKYYADGTLMWAKTAAHGENSVESRSIDSLPDGSIFLTGNLGGDVYFGSGENEKMLASQPGDGYIAKYDSSGNLVRAELVPVGSLITATADGSVFFPTGVEDVILIKFGPDGSKIWEHKLLGDSCRQGSESVWGRAVTVMKNGSVIVSGSFECEVTLNVGDEAITLEKAGKRSVFLAGLDSAGKMEWVETILAYSDGTSDENTTTVSTAQHVMFNEEYVYITGSFDNQAIFGKGENEVI